jgi:hypothetical protein
MIQAPAANITELFFTDFRTKLECFLDQAGKVCQGQTLITKIPNSQSKRFHNILPRT